MKYPNSGIWALLFTFTIGMGDYGMEQNAYAGKYEVILWLIWLLCVVFLQLIMMNLLIAIMGNTYSQVESLGQSSSLKEKCALINENEFLMDREVLFKYSRYIVVA